MHPHPGAGGAPVMSSVSPVMSMMSQMSQMPHMGAPGAVGHGVPGSDMTNMQQPMGDGSSGSAYNGQAAPSMNAFGQPNYMNMSQGIYR
jgi:hypothetical protein